MYSGKYSVEELKLIASSGVALEDVDKQWALFPDQNLDTVIGSVVMLKKGQGQERNEGFTPASEPNT